MSDCGRGGLTRGCSDRGVCAHPPSATRKQSMPDPTLSVIIPAHNAEPFIAETLLSLRCQDLSPEELEIVVVNDGSADATAEIAGGACRSVKHFQLITNEQPSGVSAARNTGLRAAQGDYIAFIDADDWFANGHLRVMLDAITRLGVDFVRCDQIQAIGRTRQLRRAPVFRRNEALRTHDYIAHGWTQTMVDFPNTNTGLFARRLAGNGTLFFDESLYSAEDREWNWRLMLEADSFAVLDAPGAYYRRGVSDSLTAVYNETQLHFIPSCAKTIAQTRRCGNPAFTLKALHNLFALADIHLQRRAEMPRNLYRRLVDGVAEASATATPDELDEVFRSFRPERVRRLRPIMRRMKTKGEA